MTPDCELIGAYVTDAVTEEERAEFDAHLAGCARCQAEIGSLYEVTAVLAASAAVAPPAAVRAQVLGLLAQTPQLPPRLPVWTPPPRRKLPDAGESADRPGVGRRTALRWTLAAAAALVVGAGAAGTVTGWRAANQRSQDLADRKTLLAAPDAQLVGVKIGTTGEGSYLVSKQQNRALFTADRLPELPAGHLFQQWTIVGQKPVPNVTFTSVADGIFLTGDIRDAAALAMSIEPGPATTPTTDAIVALAKLA